MECQRMVVEAAELFLKENRVEVGFSSWEKKERGYNPIILLNGVRVYKKNFGNLIFIYCEQAKPFEKKWPELSKDLCNQVLAMASHY